MSRDTVKAYSKGDLVAAQKQLNLQAQKLGAAIDADNFSEACSAIRAIESECQHASRVAAVLSFNNRNSHTNIVPRMGHGNNTGAAK